MATVKELRYEVADVIKEMKGLLDKAENSKRSMTDVEDKRYKELDLRVDSLKEQIRRLERMEELEETRKTVVNPINPGLLGGKGGMHDVDPDKDFRNIGEFLHSLAAFRIDGRRDKRLDRMQEERAQSFGTGAEGGFALPEQFRPEIWEVQPQAARIRPRALVIAPGQPPDAKLIIPALDQTSAQNIYGGVVMTHGGEAVTLTETDVALRQLIFEPKKIGAYVVCTNELLNNWAACSSYIGGQLMKARVGQEEFDFLRGSGVNRSTGIINSACKIEVTRSAANTIAWTDILNMYARVKQGGNLIWLASPSTISELMDIHDAGTHLLWLPVSYNPGNIAGQIPQTLLGAPVIWEERLPKLGTPGDIVLADLSYYGIKDGSGPDLAVATELLFLTDRVVFRLTWRVDGRALLTEPLGLEGDTSETVSPFITLSA